MYRANRKSKKSKQGGKHARHSQAQTDEDFSFDDASIYSYDIDETGENINSEVILSAPEKIESKLQIAIERCSEKSIDSRIQALQVINDIFMHNVMCDYVLDRRFTLTEVIRSSLKRGKGQEQILAARLAGLLIIQLQGEEETVSELSSLLKSIIRDNRALPDVRAKCCQSLAVIQLISGDKLDLIEMSKQFEEIFSESESISSKNSVLQKAALSAWALMLTLIPSGDLVSLIERNEILGSFDNLMELLESQNFDMKMTAGEAIVILLECGRKHDENFLEEYMEDLTEKAKELATESQRFVAKRNQKEQRASFRDICRYLENGFTPENSVQIETRMSKQCLELDTWAAQHQYNSICALLESGMHTHLLNNSFLRNIFEMESGDEDTATAYNFYMDKYTKRAVNAANFKAQSIMRREERGKKKELFY